MNLYCAAAYRLQEFITEIICRETVSNLRHGGFFLHNSRDFEFGILL